MTSQYSSYPSTMLGTYTPTPLKKVHYGPNALETQLVPSIRFLLAHAQRTRAGEDADVEVREEDVKGKVMIVTGRSLMEKTPVIKDVEKVLMREGFYGLTFSDIAQHAPIADIQRAKQLALDNEIDLLLSIGGGSPIDSTKAISHFVREAKGGKGAFLPHLAVPTTLSVAETTQNAGYTSEEGKKVGVNHPSLPPSVIIYDPLLTLHTPLHLLISTGVRALDHAVETLYRPKVPKGVKDMALWSIAGLMSGLERCHTLAKEKGERKGEGLGLGEEEVRVRTRLMVDAWQALWPLSSVGALGLSHALGHALGATYAVPHGMCSCLTLGTSVRHLSQKLSGDDLDYLSMAVAFVPSKFLPTSNEGKKYTIEDVQAMSEEEKRKAARMVGESIEVFLKAVELETKLSEWDVPKKDLEPIGDKIVETLGGYEMPKEEFANVVKDVLREMSSDMPDEESAPVQGVSKQRTPQHTFAHGKEQEKDRFPLGTRASQLALIQAHAVAELLGGHHKGQGYSFPVAPMSVAGDRNKKDPLYLLTNQQAGTGSSVILQQEAGAKLQIAKSLWTEELEEALMQNKLDVIVHCLKDMPTQLPGHCEIGAILPRENPHDALVVKKGLPYERLSELPEGSVVGTSSVRRIAQIRKIYPGLKVMDIRGNLDTRLRKLDDPNGPYSAIILAAAGMNRMGWQARITSIMSSPEILYAVGQGALALEIRAGDERVKEMLRGVGDWEAEWSTGAERGLLRELEGGCSVPVGVECFIEEITGEQYSALGKDLETFETDPRETGESTPLLHQSGKGRYAKLRMTVCVTSLDGKKQVVHEPAEVLVKSFLEADRWGHRVAAELKGRGGKEILDEIDLVRKQREEAGGV